MNANEIMKEIEQIEKLFKKMHVVYNSKQLGSFELSRC